MKNLSGLELSELIYMSSAMLDQIEKFSHVSDKMPKKLKTDLRNYYEKLNAEYDRRENDITNQNKI